MINNYFCVTILKKKGAVYYCEAKDVQMFDIIMLADTFSGKYTSASQLHQHF